MKNGTGPTINARFWDRIYQWIYRHNMSKWDIASRCEMKKSLCKLFVVSWRNCWFEKWQNVRRFDTLMSKTHGCVNPCYLFGSVHGHHILYKVSELMTYMKLIWSEGERERIIYQTWHLAAKRMSRVNTLDFCYIIALYHNEMADLIPPYLRAKSPMQQVGLNMELHNPVAHQFDHRLPYSNGSFEKLPDFQISKWYFWSLVSAEKVDDWNAGAAPFHLAE